MRNGLEVFDVRARKHDFQGVVNPVGAARRRCFGKTGISELR
jgi:hypothetical protein